MTAKQKFDSAAQPAAYGRLPPGTNPSRLQFAYHRDVAFRCALAHRVRKTSVWIGSERHLHHVSLGHLAICAATNSLSTWTTLPCVNQNLCCRFMPRPKLGCSHPTASAAAPATLRVVQLQGVGREQMAVAADIGYGHGFEDTLQGKAHYMSFGCSKARPRYHFFLSH